MMKPSEIGARGPLGEAYLGGRLAQARLQGEFRPSRREDVAEIEALGTREREGATAAGLGVLRRGEVAYGVLAAGASTRMNLAEVPAEARRLLERAGRAELKSKALVPVVEVGGRVLSFLDLFLANVERLSAETATACPVVVLVSETNGEEIERTIEAGALDERDRPLGFTYPAGLFSLSHVALPFPMNDSLYGLTPDSTEDFGIHLGALTPRGERNVLIASLDSLLRASSNPFFPYMKTRIEENIDNPSPTQATASPQQSANAPVVPFAAGKSAGWLSFFKSFLYAPPEEQGDDAPP